MIGEAKVSNRPWLSTGIVDSVIRGRRAIRRFSPQAVPLEMVRGILDAARHAPSASNIQPWRCHVVTGAARDQLVAEALRAFRSEFAAHGPEYEFYPPELPQPFVGRRAGFGAKLGAALNIDQADVAARMAFLARNFMFFEAPVGIIFTIDRRLERASLIDYGCFLQNVMLGARARGLDTCPQQTWAMLHKVIRGCLPLADEEMVVCGMAMGWADPDGAENRLDLNKEGVEAFATFYNEPIEEELALAA